MQASDGNLYVTTASGTIMRIAPSAAESVLYSPGTNGVSPGGAVIQWTDGNFYGLAGGGTGNGGTFFQLTPSGQLTVLYQFGSNSAEGLYPLTLVKSSNSNEFFGITSAGGLVPDCGGSGCGTVYQITPTGVESAVYQFSVSNAVFGSGAAAVIQGSDGTLYGITMGEESTGTVFSLSSEGVFTTLHTFAPMFPSS